MKIPLVLIVAVTLTGVLSAQYVPSVSGSSIAAGEINSKPASQALAAVPAANCTVAKDFVLNTLTSTLYMCTASPNVWSVVGGSGGSGTVTNVATTSPITGGPFSTTGTIACATCVTSVASLTLNQIVLGGGTQASSALGSLGTSVTVLHGNAGGAPTFGSVALTADVTGVLPAANGGTGQSTYVVGDVLFASSSSVLSKLADVATGNAIISGGVGVAPTWGKIALTAHVSGILPAANGGTGIANTATLTLGSSSQNWATLGTGLVKNTTTAGALTNGLSADVLALWTGTCNSGTFLRGDGSCQAPAGGGTVTVVGAGNLTSTAIVTGGGSQALQTAAPTATMDGSGNIATPGSASFGVGSGVAGIARSTQGSSPGLVANTWGWASGTAAPASGAIYTYPAASATGIMFATNTTNVHAVTHISPSTAGFVLTSNGASAPTFQASAGGAPGGSSGQYQYNSSGSFAGQAAAFTSGSPTPTTGQNVNDGGHLTLTAGGNLSLSGTADQSITVATSVPCTEVWSVLKLTIVTAFTGGTGGLQARWQHGSNDLTERFDMTVTAGNIYPSNNPGVCARGTSADLKLTFNGDGTNNMSGYSTGAVTYDFGGFQVQ